MHPHQRYSRGAAHASVATGEGHRLQAGRAEQRSHEAGPPPPLPGADRWTIWGAWAGAFILTACFWFSLVALAGWLASASFAAALAFAYFGWARGWWNR